MRYSRNEAGADWTLAGTHGVLTTLVDVVDTLLSEPGTGKAPAHVKDSDGIVVTFT